MLVRKHVGIKELTPAIVNEFIKKIIDYAPDYSKGVRLQQVNIVFNFVGESDRPQDPHKKTEKTVKRHGRKAIPFRCVTSL